MNSIEVMIGVATTTIAATETQSNTKKKQIVFRHSIHILHYKDNLKCIAIFMDMIKWYILHVI